MKQKNKHVYYRLTREQIEVAIKWLDEYAEDLGYNEKTYPLYSIISQLRGKIGLGISKNGK